MVVHIYKVTEMAVIGAEDLREALKKAKAHPDGFIPCDDVAMIVLEFDSCKKLKMATIVEDDGEK